MEKMPMAKQKVIASNEQAVLLATRLIQTAQFNGLEITITIPPQNNTAQDASPVCYEGDRSLIEHKREDLAWLQAHVTQFPDELARLCNHYVAVFNKRIVSIGDSKELVMIGAAASLNVLPDEILIVPVQVIGTESEDDWLHVKRDLGIS